MGLRVSRKILLTFLSYPSLGTPTFGPKPYLSKCHLQVFMRIFLSVFFNHLCRMCCCGTHAECYITIRADILKFLLLKRSYSFSENKWQ